MGFGAAGGGVDLRAGCSSVGPDRMLAKDMGSAARAGFWVLQTTVVSIIRERTPSRCELGALESPDDGRNRGMG